MFVDTAQTHCRHLASQLWFLQSCETKSGTESLGTRLAGTHPFVLAVLSTLYGQLTTHVYTDNSLGKLRLYLYTVGQSCDVGFSLKVVQLPLALSCLIYCLLSTTGGRKELGTGTADLSFWLSPQFVRTSSDVSWPQQPTLQGVLCTKKQTYTRSHDMSPAQDHMFSVT